MYNFEASVFINSPPREVFAFVSKPANNTQWQRVTSAEWTSDGPPGVGSTAKSEVSLLGFNMEEKNEITAWDPPNQYSFKQLIKMGMNEFTNKFEPQRDGTLMTTLVHIELVGFYKLIEGLIGKLSEKHIASSRAKLKRVLETSADR